MTTLDTLRATFEPAARRTVDGDGMTIRFEPREWTTRYIDGTTTKETYLTAVAVDPEYADVDEAGQLALGCAGEQRAIPGLAKSRQHEED